MEKQLCKQPEAVQRVFDPRISQTRKRAILFNILKWINGTEIKYFFLEGDEAQQNVVRRAFIIWKSVGMNLKFKEVDDVNQSMIRIGFDHRDGSWSYVGRDNLSIPKPSRTMNFGWSLTEDDYGLTTALHEIGHAIGLQHEHQSPFTGIQWNVTNVYKEFQGYPNYWSKADIDHNIIQKLPSNKVAGSPWDPKSIMEYQFGPNLILQPAAYRTGVYPPGIISIEDAKGVRAFYPLSVDATPDLTLQKSAPIKALSGSQSDYSFKAPHTGNFTIQTVGSLDTLMVIYQIRPEGNLYIGGDDDSGLEKNSKLLVPLEEGKEYLISIKVTYAPPRKGGSVIVS